LKILSSLRIAFRNKINSPTLRQKTAEG